MKGLEKIEKETVIEVKFERMDTVDRALGIMYLTELKSNIRYSVLDINVKNGYIIAVMYEVFFEDYRDRLKKTGDVLEPIIMFMLY